MPRKSAKEKLLGVSTKEVTITPKKKASFLEFKMYVGYIHNKKVVPSDRVLRFQKASQEYLSKIPQQDQLMILEWTDVLDQIVNYRMQGFSWESILRKNFGFKSMQDAVEGNLNGFDCFISATGRKFLDQTDWQKSLSAQDKNFIQRLFKIQVFNQTEAKAFFDLEESNIRALWGDEFQQCVMAFNEYYDPFKLVLMYWSWTQYKPEKFVKHTKISQDVFSCRGHLLNGNSVGPFSEVIMNQIVDQSVYDLERIFSMGPTLKEPITLYRGLQEKPDDRKSFRGASTDVVNAIGYAGGHSCCLMIIHVHPGVKTFEFSQMLRKPPTDEHEVMIPPSVNLKYKSARLFLASEWPEVAQEYSYDIQAYEYDWFP